MRFAALLVLVVAAALAVSPVASSASKIGSKDQAYMTARACLLQHGARFVARRGDGGGYVFFRGVAHVQYWTYHTWLGLVDKVTYYAFPGLPGAKKKQFIACIMKNV